VYLPTFILGYHGCDRTVGERILAGKEHLELSKNDYDWLGSGVYFWENDPVRALQWAKQLAQRPDPKIKEPFVLGAIIYPGFCLDLTEETSRETLKWAYAAFAKLFAEAGVPMPKNEQGYKSDRDWLKRNLDCAVVNYLHDARKEGKKPPFDTVRAPFGEGKPLYKGSGFKDKTHVQVCVRAPKMNVRGYFRPSEGPLTPTE
jgi:hypothetical protein